MSRAIRLVIWITPKGVHKLYFSTDVEMGTVDIIEYYITGPDSK